MIEMRWVKRDEAISDEIGRTVRRLQFRTIENPLEIGLHEPIWSDWQDVPDFYEDEIHD